MLNIKPIQLKIGQRAIAKSGKVTNFDEGETIEFVRMTKNGMLFIFKAVSDGVEYIVAENEFELIRTKKHYA